MATKPVKDFPDYEVSNTGKVWSHCRGNGRWLKSFPNDNGYLTVRVWRDNKGKTRLVHQLVAEVWVPNPHNYPHVNHMDGDKTNNHYTNLEWVTDQQNRKHAYATGLREQPDISPVDCFSKTGKKLRTYPSIKAAARASRGRCAAGNIAQAVNGKAITAGGYQWRLASEKIARLPPLTASQVSQSVHTCANYHVRNVTTGEEFFSHAEVRAAGYNPCNVASVCAGNRHTHAGCEWERLP